MASKIVYKASVEHDLKRLDKPTAARILSKLDTFLSAHPDAGAPLTGEFKGLFRYRLGDYRVIYTKTPEALLILRIAHRKDVYR